MKQTILIALIAVLATLQLSSMFRRQPPPPDNLGEIEALQKVIEAKSETLAISREQQDKIIDALLKKDSIIAGQVKTQTKIIYEKIPTVIRNLSHDELRRAVADY